MMKLRMMLFAIVLRMCVAASSSHAQSIQSAAKVVVAADIQWEQLNPARGDASPQAATLWGDRRGTVATGFLVKFVDGFSSPPHIHNVSYRGVVIAGEVHNDDPSAAPLWMPTGSFWTQPAGEAHITSSRGPGVAYIEIEKGPYLVLPVDQAQDNGERPVNVVPSNLVWLDASNTSLIESPATESSGGARIAFLWGQTQGQQLYGTLVRLPAGFTGELRSQAESLQAVVIDGEVQHQLEGDSETKTLAPGSYVSSQGELTHRIQCEAEDGCLVYVRSRGRFTIHSK